ncbi:hypothetical protein JKI95_00545 [Corynebacterium aquatimens]|uniref:Rv1476 family membrane protein n=1 Tax=Corynebacterium aquatimens TaxID=1190508 RepID=UPI0025417221|nr:DUF6676 family protein [Corynebacterium aquatimens]QYH19726.1 hypothetical protein JKI95_00545 [Corynebacterium aquatimens]
MTAQHSPSPAFDSLVGQLRDDGIAFGADNPVNEVLEADLARALAEVTGEGTAPGQTHVVVLEHTPPMVADLRDLAQDLLLQGDADTVLIRTPHVAIGVSDTLNRSQVEVGQHAMVQQADYAEGVRQFVAAAAEASVPWGWLQPWRRLWHLP